MRRTDGEASVTNLTPTGTWGSKTRYRFQGLSGVSIYAKTSGDVNARAALTLIHSFCG
jgi:hypothetical protein